MSDETISQTARPLPRPRTMAWSTTAGANAETAWRRWATRHRAAAAMLGGLAGVQIASLFGFWLGGIGLDRLDFDTANGAIFLPQATHVQQFLIGGLSHYMDGVFFGLIFAVAAWPLLPLPATRAGNLAKAMIFSTVLAIVAAFVVLHSRVRAVVRQAQRFSDRLPPRVEVRLQHSYRPLDLRRSSGLDLQPVGRRAVRGLDPDIEAIISTTQRSSVTSPGAGGAGRRQVPRRRAGVRGSRRPTGALAARRVRSGTGRR